MMRRSIGLTLVAYICLCRMLVLADLISKDADEITLEWEKIFVKIGDGATFSLMVDPNDSVPSLIEDMSELEGMPHSLLHQIGLAMDQTQAQDLCSELSRYSRTNTTLYLVVPENIGRHMTGFNVRTLDGRNLPVATSLSQTVANLKDNITQWTGIPRLEQRLLLKGKVLKDERKLAQYAIYDRTTIDLGAPLEDCRRAATIFVKTLSGATIEVEVNLIDTVTDLKEKIYVETGVPAGVQSLRANERLIAGEDHLCDLGLEAGSIVHMVFMSSRITSLDQVARLREPPSVACPVNNYRAPIFREVERDAGRPVLAARRATSLYKDARNWLARSGPQSRRGWDPDLFDPVARLVPNPDNDEWMRRNRQALDIAWRTGTSERDRLETSQVKIILAVRPYRVAANLTSKTTNPRRRPGISLAGKYPDASPQKLVTLGADVNNWAPDTLSDSGLMRLFEVSERVRQVLASDAQTSEGILSIADQRRMNRAILLTYLAALAGYPTAVEYNQAGDHHEVECSICRDDLAAEPAIKLACEHAFHSDCILSWASHSIREERVAKCPYCQKGFMFPYEALGQSELKTIELQSNQNL